MNRVVHAIIWLALIILSVLVLLPKPDENTLIDFASGWSAARLLNSGRNPYDLDGLVENERVAGWDMTDPVIPWNPPWALSVMIPFALLPFEYAKWCWLLINCFLILFLSDYWWISYGGPRRYRMAAWLVSLWFFPCIVALYFGQLSLLVLAGVTGMAWCLKRDKTAWLGFFVLLASVKPHLLLPMWVILLLWAFRHRNWSTLFWAASGVVLANIVIIGLRPEIYRDYLSAAASDHGPVIWATPTIGTALRILFKGISKWIVFLPSAVGLTLTIMLWRRWAHDFSWEKHLNFILLLSLATASYAWIFDWALLLPGAIRIVAWFRYDPRRQWVALAGLVAVMFAFVVAQAQGLFPLGVVWFPFGLALVYAWASRRHRRIVLDGAAC